MKKRSSNLSKLTHQAMAVLSVVGFSGFPLSAIAETFRLREATVWDVNQAFDRGDLTSEQLVQLYLNRIQAYEDRNAGINALISINSNALAEAKKLDRERQEKGKRSPLHGIPIILKDNYDTADMPTTAGSVLLKGSVPPDDSPQLENLWSLMKQVTAAEFEPQIENYLKTLNPSFPDTLESMISLSLSNRIANSIQALNPGRIHGFKESLEHRELADIEYLSIIHFEFPKVRQEILGIMQAQRLNAIVFPTMLCPASPLYTIQNDPTYQCNVDDPYTPGYLANVSGFPGISVPMGFTEQGLPLGLTFFGAPYTEQELLGFAYAYEQATQFRRPPATTPSLPGETLDY